MAEFDHREELLDEAGRPIRLDSRGQAELLRALISRRGHWISREELARKLWPNSEPKRARGALRQTAARMKQALSDPSWLESTRDALRVTGLVDPTDAEIQRALKALRVLLDYFREREPARGVRILAAGNPILTGLSGDVAAELIEPFLPHLRRSRPDDVALLIRYAYFLMYKSENEKGLKLVREARAAAVALKRRTLVLEAECMVGWFEFYCGRFSAALRTARRVNAGLTDEDDARSRIRAQILLGTMSWEVENVDEGAEILERTGASALSSGFLDEAGWALTNLSALYFYERRWADFLRVLAVLEARLELISDMRVIDLIRLLLAVKPAAHRDPELALASLLEHRSEFATIPLRVLLLVEWECHLCVMAGAFERAAARLDEAEQIRKQISCRLSPYEQSLYRRHRASVSSRTA